MGPVTESDVNVQTMTVLPKEIIMEVLKSIKIREVIIISDLCFLTITCADIHDACCKVSSRYSSEVVSITRYQCWFSCPNLNLLLL